MCKGLLGKKLGMTAIFNPHGEYMPVTVIEAGPCVVTQIKTKDSDGYNALQLGFGEKKKKRLKAPLKGHFAKSGDHYFEHLKEFPVEDPDAYSLGQVITLEIFTVGERVDVSGKSKGRGFSGVVRRHGFHGGRATHGSKTHRMPGSIGCSAWPSRVIKGKKLPGRYGFERKTIQNLEIIDIRPKENLLMIKGGIPGARSGLVTVNKPKFFRATTNRE
jgi:large subunit ribosomal protein L3